MMGESTASGGAQLGIRDDHHRAKGGRGKFWDLLGAERNSQPSGRVSQRRGAEPRAHRGPGSAAEGISVSK